MSGDVKMSNDLKKTVTSDDKVSYQAYKTKMELMAEDSFKNHRLQYSEEHRWIIRHYNEEKKYWEGFYWTEIVVVANGLLVHGDIDTCLFKYYSGDKHPMARVHWIAKSGVDYLVEKCSIGMDDRDVCRTFDEDVALWEIDGHIRDVVHDICEEAGYETPDFKIANSELLFDITNELRDWEAEGNEDSELQEAIARDNTIAAWLRARRRIGGDHWEFIQNDLYEDLVDAGDSDAGELVYKLGVVPEARLFYAKAACKKLVELIEETKYEQNKNQ